MADKNTTVEVLVFEADTASAVKNVNELTKANKALKDEKKDVDTTTTQGVAKSKELDAQIQKNTQTIKDNMTAVDKVAKSNLDLKGSVDRVIPGLGSAVSGFLDMTKASLAFIATPIGLVVTALGAAIGALMAYFKGSEEGQNKWNKVVAIGSTLLEKLMDLAENLGGALVAIFEDPQKAIEDFWKMLKENVVNRFEGLLELIPALGKSIELLFKGEFAESGKVAFDAVAKVTTGIENASDKIVAFTKEVIATTNLAIEQGLKLAEIQAKIDKDERELIVQRSKIDLEVSKLREKAISQEGDAKRKTINEAIALERKLADAEVKHAKDKQAQAKLELKANGDDKDALMKVAEANAAVINAEAQRYQATLRFSKEIEKLNDAEAKQVQKNADDKIKAELDWKAKQLKNVEESEAQMMAILADSKKSQDDIAKKSTDFQNQLNENVANVYMKGLKLTFDATKIHYKEGFELFKKGKLKEVYASTKSSAIKSYESLSSIPFVGPVLGFIAAAAATAFGLSQATGLLGINLGFKTGSYTGDGDPNDIAGVVHKREFVMPAPVVAKYGKEHFQSYMDGSVVANSMTKGMSGSAGQNQMEVYVSWKEFTEYRDRQDVKKAIVTA